MNMPGPLYKIIKNSKCQVPQGSVRNMIFTSRQNFKMARAENQATFRVVLILSPVGRQRLCCMPWNWACVQELSVLLPGALALPWPVPSLVLSVRVLRIQQLKRSSVWPHTGFQLLEICASHTPGVK